MNVAESKIANSEIILEIIDDIKKLSLLTQPDEINQQSRIIARKWVQLYQEELSNFDLKNAILTGPSGEKRYLAEPVSKQGGFAVVCRALDLRTGRLVALKRVKNFDNGHTASVTTLHESLKREATTTASDAWKRRHVVRINDLYDDPNYSSSPVMVMDWYGRGSVQDLISKYYYHPDETQNAYMPISEVEKKVIAMAEAVGALRSDPEINHRDLKPANMMLADYRSGDDEIDVIDFGSAQSVKREANNSVVGTPAYLSPEECAKKTTDARSDGFVLATILFEMLLGGKPFSVNNEYSYGEMRPTDDEKIALQIMKGWAGIGNCQRINKLIADRFSDPNIQNQIKIFFAQALDRIPGRRFSTPYQLAREFLNIKL